VNNKVKHFAPRVGAFALAGALCVSLYVGSIVGAQPRFTDVPEGHWAFESVEYAVDKGYFSGTSENTFSPDTTMTRAMLWTVLARMDNYTGTAGTDAPWYQNGRDWAMANGISDGTNPDGNLTREQFATMLYNFAKHTGKNTDKNNSVLNPYSDRGNIASYAVDAMAWAVTQGIISGTSSTTITPAGLATRSQAAVMLMRFDKVGEGTPVNPEKPDYETIFRVMNAPPMYPGDTIEVGQTTYIAIGSEPYGANVEAGVTYTVTCSDPSMVKIYPDSSISQDEVCYGVKALKAGTATITAVGSDGFRGSVTITIKGDETNPTDPDNPNIDWGNFAEMKQEIVKLINEERVRVGLDELKVSAKVMQAAQIRADECTTLYDHTRPDGSGYGTVFKEVGLATGGRENIAEGFTTAQRVVSAWIASPGHYDALTDSDCNYIGIGIAVDASGHYYYSTLFTPIGN
jgi:uncharacterized protein YkwD